MRLQSFSCVLRLLYHFSVFALPFFFMLKSAILMPKNSMCPILPLKTNYLLRKNYLELPEWRDDSWSGICSDLHNGNSNPNIAPFAHPPVRMLFPGTYKSKLFYEHNRTHLEFVLSPFTRMKLFHTSSLIVFPVTLAATRLGRAISGDHNSRETCIPCHYEGLQDLCVPHKILPFIETSWVCNEDHPSIIIDNDIWACLMAGSEQISCENNRSCVWCAEPIFGLCVTPGLASKMKHLPIFRCDSLKETMMI